MDVWRRERDDDTPPRVSSFARCSVRLSKSGNLFPDPDPEKWKERIKGKYGCPNAALVRSDGDSIGKLPEGKYRNRNTQMNVHSLARQDNFMDDKYRWENFGCRVVWCESRHRHYTLGRMIVVAK
jgi:hypothetical protein